MALRYDPSDHISSWPISRVRSTLIQDSSVCIIIIHHQFTLSYDPDPVPLVLSSSLKWHTNCVLPLWTKVSLATVVVVVAVVTSCDQSWPFGSAWPSDSRSDAPLWTPTFDCKEGNPSGVHDTAWLPAWWGKYDCSQHSQEVGVNTGKK